MSARSSKSPRPISPATPNAISSPASADGALPPDSPDGVILAFFGLDPAPANPSPLPGSKAARPTPATSGPSSPASLRSVNLQSSLANRLRARLDGIGSPEYALTWKEWAMASGPPICARRASGRRTSGNDSGGLASGWRSPDANQRGGDYSDPAKVLTRLDSGHQVNLNDQVVLAGWPTTTRDWKDVGDMSRSMVRKDGQSRMDTLGRVATTLGPPPSGTPASTGKPGASRLNPAFSLWLMGYPVAWASCGVRAMPSSRKSGRSSSRPTSTDRDTHELS